MLTLVGIGMNMKFSWKQLPYLLLVAYVIFICYSFYNMNARLNYLLNHPVHVLQDVREIKTRLGEMKYTLPSLLTSPEMNYEDILSVLESQEEMQDKSFGSIKALFVGNPKYLDELRAAFAKIRAARRLATQSMIGNSDYNRSMDVYKKLIAPCTEDVNMALNSIMNSAKNLLAVTRDKTSRDVIINIVLTVIVGVFIAFAFFVVNIRESRKTRELEDRDKLFNLLSQNVDEVFIIVGPARTFDYVTSNSERLIGINSMELQECREKLFAFLPEEDAAWLRSCLADASIHDSVQEHTIIKDCGNKVFRIHIYPIKDGKNSRAIIALQDKTADFKQQQALSDALENAHAASVAKSNFLSHMSHEIRTPMNAIIGMTTIALTKINNPARVEDCLGKIAESSRHLLRLINDVLDMSKIENDKLSISHEAFSLPMAITNINDLICSQAEERGLNLEIFQENVEDEELLGDQLRLNQILLNIISNALKFTPKGGTITLKIRQLVRKGNNTRLAFTISDTGIGMSEEFLQRLYRPFEQATTGTAAKYGGTGLGMSITFNLVKLMGGSINVESKEGVGTSFHVELPFGVAETQRRNDTLPRLKVLIVDDDPGTCEHATLLLEKMGLSVRWCTNGYDAIERIQEARDAATPFEVCFIDWKMPDMDGAETARRIREVVGDDLLIIIISAYDWSPIEEKARKAGVNDFVAKPFFASTLYNVLLTTTQRYDVHPSDGIASEGPYDFSGKRILLVEDNEFNREIAHEFLEMVNVEVENAENGKEAVDKFMASEPGYYDLILMDVQMPVMDGYEATKAIRNSSHADANTIHILAMTANAFSEDVANALACGMNGHISKPVEVKDLYKLLRQHLSSGEKR